jgi:4-amino-4-deoxy-L-arabinose transferase-like glycosyltransferase
MLAAICLLAWHYVPDLSDNGLTQYDEFYTLDRTSSVLSHGDVLTIYSNHVPSFNKPPLQYWLGAALMKLGAPLNVALKLMPFVWAIGTLGLTGVLAQMLAPESMVAGLAAILFLSGSKLFWDSATSAMLDSGAAFFTIAAAVAFLMALKRPGMCWFVAVLVGLGALQKAPIGLVCVMVAWFAIARFHPESLTLVRSAPYSSTRKWSVALACVLALAWPLFQSALHGPIAFRAAVLREMKERFVPGLPENLAGLKFAWLSWIADDAILLWLPALAMAVVLPLVVRRPAAYLIASWVILFFLAMTFARGDTYERYLLIVLPFLSAALAGGLAALIGRPLVAAAASSALWAASTGFGLPQPTRAPPAIDKYLPLLQRFRDGVQPQESLVFCDWTKANETIFPGALSHYASAGKPFVMLRERANLGLADPQLRGLCLNDNFVEIEQELVDVVVVEHWEDWVIWTAQDVSR